MYEAEYWGSAPVSDSAVVLAVPLQEERSSGIASRRVKLFGAG